MARSQAAGSPRSLRERNRRLIIDTLTTAGSQTQAALSRLTGLSAGTISNIVAELKDENRVATTPVVRAGRRSLAVSLAADSRVVVGVDIGRVHLRLLACDPAQHTFGDVEVPLESGHRPHDTFALARRLMDNLLATHDVDRSRACVAVVALPASLSPESGQIVEDSALPHWARIDLRPIATAALGVPVALEHDARLGALAHTSFGRHSGVHSLVYVKIASGIGLGLAVDGQPYASTSGLGGEIGHFPVEGGMGVCYCGKRGCLETISSAARIVADFARIRPGRDASIEAVVAAVEEGDSAIVRLLVEAGTALGRQLGLICDLLSPDVILLGGPLMRVGRPYLDAAVAAAHQVALLANVGHTRFELSDLHGADEVYGACAYGVRSLTPH